MALNKNWTNEMHACSEYSNVCVYVCVNQHNYKILDEPQITFPGISSKIIRTQGIPNIIWLRGKYTRLLKSQRNQEDLRFLRISKGLRIPRTSSKGVTYIWRDRILVSPSYATTRKNDPKLDKSGSFGKPWKFKLSWNIMLLVSRKVSIQEFSR